MYLTPTRNWTLLLVLELRQHVRCCLATVSSPETRRNPAKSDPHGRGGEAAASAASAAWGGTGAGGACWGGVGGVVRGEAAAAGGARRLERRCGGEEEEEGSVRDPSRGGLLSADRDSTGRIISFGPVECDVTRVPSRRVWTGRIHLFVRSKSNLNLVFPRFARPV